MSYYKCENCEEINKKGWGKTQKCKKCKTVQGEKKEQSELVEALNELHASLESIKQVLEYIAVNVAAPPLEEPPQEEGEK